MKMSSVRMPDETLKGSNIVRMNNVQKGLNKVIMPDNVVRIPKVNDDDEADGANCVTGLSLSLGEKIVAEKAEMGLSLEMEKGGRGPANAGVAAGGAALS